MVSAGSDNCHEGISLFHTWASGSNKCGKETSVVVVFISFSSMRAS